MGKVSTDDGLSITTYILCCSDTRRNVGEVRTEVASGIVKRRNQVLKSDNARNTGWIVLTALMIQAESQIQSQTIFTVSIRCVKAGALRSYVTIDKVLYLRDIRKSMQSLHPEEAVFDNNR